MNMIKIVKDNFFSRTFIKNIFISFKSHHMIKFIKDNICNLKFFKNILSRRYNSILEVFLIYLKELDLLMSFSRSFISSVNRKIVCFGSMNGMGFIDNPKYLFLYLKSNINYDSYWFTSSRDLYNSLKKKGYNVIFNYSFKAMKILRSAGYIITGWGLPGDFLPISYSKKSIIIRTWHGHQFKNLKVNKGKSIEEINLNYEDIISQWEKGIFKGDSRYDYMISPGKNVNKFLVTAFLLDPSKIIITGLPRNDILFQINENLKDNLKEKYNISSQFKRIFLYAPTFRDNYKLVKFPLYKEEFKELNEFLKDTDTVLICKSHFADTEDFIKSSENIVIMDKFIDMQELIIISDLLITDYSTVYFDFILVKKPVILFPYDLDDYIKYPNIYFKLEDIAVGPIVKNGKELITGLKTFSNWLPQCKKRIVEIRNKYWDYHNGKSCERFFNKLFTFKRQ